MNNEYRFIVEQFLASERDYAMNRIMEHWNVSDIRTYWQARLDLVNQLEDTIKELDNEYNE